MPTTEEVERESSLRRFFEECEPSETGLVSRAKLFQCFQARTGANLNAAAATAATAAASATTPAAAEQQLSEQRQGYNSRGSELIDFEEFMARVVADPRARDRAALLLPQGQSFQAEEGKTSSEARTPPAMERNLFLSALANGKLAVSGHVGTVDGFGFLGLYCRQKETWRMGLQNSRLQEFGYA